MIEWVNRKQVGDEFKVEVYLEKYLLMHGGEITKGM